jgi:hypothetical protein
MARYKEYDYSQGKFIPIYFDRQILPGTFEYSLHPPTQETRALAVEEFVALAAIVRAIDLLCFGGFRQPADDPPKPWRRWVCLLGTTGLPVGLHYLINNEIDLSIFDRRHRNDEMGAPAYDPSILLKIIKIRNCVTNPGSLDDRK